jgi:ferredoxin
MHIQPDPALVQNVIALGGGDVKRCYQCGACASVCSLSTTENPFPRNQMLAAQWGLKQKLAADLSPWLCFYCGECSKMCPRGANPGETMMALRRYLTAQYDWSGLSRRMYRSAVWEVGILGLVAAIVIMLFTVPQNFGFHLLAHAGAAATASVMLDKFAPKEIVHVADRTLAVLLGLLLLVNAGRMFLGLTRGDSVPARSYLTKLPYLVVQGITQVRWRECDDSGAKLIWLRHLLLVTGYAAIFSLVVLFLPWFQVENSSFHWTSIPGYYATAVLLGTTAWIIADRMRKSAEMHRFSHISDWLFPILLFLTAATGILVHVLRLMDLAMATYVTYTVHIAVAVPMLVVEVPFGKWAHLLYRPLAIYVAAVRSAVRSTLECGREAAALE